METIFFAAILFVGATCLIGLVAICGLIWFVVMREIYSALKARFFGPHSD